MSEKNQGPLLETQLFIQSWAAGQSKDEYTDEDTGKDAGQRHASVMSHVIASGEFQ